MAQSQGAARRQLVGDQLDYKMIRAVSNFDDKKYVMQGIGLLGQAVHAAVTGDDSYLKSNLADIQGSQVTTTENNTNGNDDDVDSTGSKVVNTTPEINPEAQKALEAGGSLGKNTRKVKKV